MVHCDGESEGFAAVRIADGRNLMTTAADLLSRGHVRSAAGVWCDAVDLLRFTGDTASLTSLAEMYRQADAAHAGEWHWMVDALVDERMVQSVLAIIE